MSEQRALTLETKRELVNWLQSDEVKEQVSRVLPKHITPERLMRVVVTAGNKSPGLYNCTRVSIFQAVLICAQAGLEPDGRLAHIIPFGKVAQVIFDYKGLITLGLRNGLDSIFADKVCENDVFDAWVENGVKRITHRVDWKKPRGEAYAYYCVSRKGDVVDVEVMSMEEIRKVRDQSRAKDSGPWVTHFDEMAKKCPIRRMSKRWDMSPEIREAMNSDDDTPDFENTGPTLRTSAPIFDDRLLEVATAAEPGPKETSKVKDLREKCKAAKVKETELLQYLVSIGKMDEAVDSLEAIAMMAPLLLDDLLTNWPDIVANMP